MAIRFEKVSYTEFSKALGSDNDTVRKIWEEIKLPKRATKGSAGYDFYAPWNFALKKGETEKIPTGIRAIMDEDKVLMLFPRSGMGFKYRFQLDNTVGIIDSDYSNSDNEGHIYAKVSCDSYTDAAEVVIKQGDAFMQGIFVSFAVTDDDQAEGVRNGGFGSTSQ